MPCRNAAVLLNESHLVDLFHGRDARANFGQPAFPQSDPALIASDAFDLRSRPAVHDHFAVVLDQVDPFANRRPAVITGARAFQASGALGKRDVAPHERIEARFFQFLRRISLGLLAVCTDHTNEPLRHDAVESGDKVVRLNAHIDEAADDVGDVVGVDGSENEVAGEGRLNSDLGGFLVANFTDHDLVGIVAQDGAQAAGESETLLLVHGNLCDAANLVFDRILNGDKFVFVALDLIDGRVERGGLAGTGGTGNQDHAIGFANVAAEAAGLFDGETNDVQSQVREFFRKRFFVEDAKNRVFTVTGGHDGDAQIDVAPLVFHAEAAVLGNTALGDVQIAQHFDAREHRGMPLLGDGLHGVLQHAIDTVFDGHLGVSRFDVDVAGAALERGEDNGLHEAHHRAGGAIASQAVAGNRLFAFFFLLGSLKGEGFGGLFEDALRLLSAFQNVADLPGGSDANQKFLSQQERQLIAHLHLAGVCRRDGQNIVVKFKRHEVVAEHQVRGDGPEQFRIDPLFPEINESEAVSLSEFARDLAFVQLIGGRCRACDYIGVLVRGGHDSLLGRPRQGERKNGEIQRNQNERDQQSHKDQ